MREHRAFCPQSIRLGQGTKLGQADWKCVSPEEVTNSLEFLLSVSETSPVRAKRSGLPYNIPYSLCVDISEVYFYSPGAARQKGIRFCDRCQLIKPDRCHHCSVCAICVLKMDHHCPWVNNCIGFSNYKFFLLFLAYALLYCLYIAATVFKYFIKYWTGELTNGRSKFHVLFLLFVAVMFFVTWWQRVARCPARTSVLACGCRKSNRQW